MSSLTQINCHNFFVNYGKLVREIKTSVKIGQPGVPLAVPCQQELTAVWDTGATGTSISRELAGHLGLTQIGWIDIEGVTGKAQCCTYLISLFLPNMIAIPELEIADCIGNIGCDVLIGMDVICMGDFAVCNKNGKTTFSFRVPSIAQINFTDKNDRNYTREYIKLGRNAPCPCGSGKKYKHCHGKNV
jgi:hypothetical protein